jgi:hypothetical protein
MYTSTYVSPPAAVCLACAVSSRPWRAEAQMRGSRKDTHGVLEGHSRGTRGVMQGYSRGCQRGAARGYSRGARFEGCATGTHGVLDAARRGARVAVGARVARHEQLPRVVGRTHAFVGGLSPQTLAKALNWKPQTLNETNLETLKCETRNPKLNPAP